MANILVTTPNYLLRYDTTAEQTWIVESGRTQYYGMSWFEGQTDLCLSHSGLDYEAINTFLDYADSETGYISYRESKSWPALSAPHQILCLPDNMIAVANTGRNCINIFDSKNWFTRQVRFGGPLWDRYDVLDESGQHINSLFFKNSTLYVLAHNFSKGTIIWELKYPSFEIVKTSRHVSTGLHNIWPREDGLIVSCDSLQAGLIDLQSGRTLWTSEDRQNYTRGLAATIDTIFVGVATRGSRAERTQGETGIWMLSAGTFQTREYRSLGQWGSVQDIRIMSELDLCHPNGPLPMSPRLQGLSPERMWTERRRREIETAAQTRRYWDIQSGACLAQGPDHLEASGDEQCLALHPEFSALNVRVEATLDVSQRLDDNIALAVRHLGPGDTNMIVVMLKRSAPGQISLSVWTNVAGVWEAPATRMVASPCLQLSLEVVESTLRLSADGEDVIVLEDIPAALTRPGAVGVRGVKGRVENLRVEAL